MVDSHEGYKAMVEMPLYSYSVENNEGFFTFTFPDSMKKSSGSATLYCMY